MKFVLASSLRGTSPGPASSHTMPAATVAAAADLLKISRLRRVG